MKIGAHLLIGQGLEMVPDIAESIGCDCFQLFLHNPRGWKRERRKDSQLVSFRKKILEKNLNPVAIHMPYLVNLASSDSEILLKSSKVLDMELDEAEKMGADYYIIHPGNCKDRERKEAMKGITSQLKPFTGGKVKILLENTAGQGTVLGKNWHELAYMNELLNGSAGLCFDTAHAFESGYDIRDRGSFEKIKMEIEKELGLENIFMVHANDSLTDIGSKADRHQHIGKGHIGIEGFENIVRDGFFGNLPFIIETPKSSIEDDMENIRKLRKLGEMYGKIRFQRD